MVLKIETESEQGTNEASLGQGPRFRVWKSLFWLIDMAEAKLKLMVAVMIISKSISVVETRD